MEHKGDPSTDFCDRCGQPTIDVAEASECETADTGPAERAPLMEIRTPDGRVVYVVNLN
jgi:hypothetical protein